MLYDYAYEVDVSENEEGLLTEEEAAPTIAAPRREDRPLWVVPAAAQEG
jgi:hypothetical protein